MTKFSAQEKAKELVDRWARANDSLNTLVSDIIENIQEAFEAGEKEAGNKLVRELIKERDLKHKLIEALKFYADEFKWGSRLPTRNTQDIFYSEEGFKIAKEFLAKIGKL